MAKENKCGQMVRNMKENGKKIGFRGKVSSYTPIKISTKVNSLQIRQMAMENTPK